MTARYAIYMAPESDTPLWRFGTAWLGRDPETGAEAVERLGLADDEHVRITATPARYGFHGTLKPPFRLAVDSHESELVTALRVFAAKRAPFLAPALCLGAMGQFLALVPGGDASALEGLAADCVTDFDLFRAPLTKDEVARRNPKQLSPTQQSYLARWGYPYVLDEFRFHMTLTGKLDPGDMSRVRPVLERATAELAGDPIRVSSVALFREPAPFEPFELIGRFALDGAC